MSDLRDFIIIDLQKGGPWLPKLLADELTWRAEHGLLGDVTGMVSVGSVLTVLHELRAKGMAVETEEGWDALAPIHVEPSGKTRQRELI